MEQWYLHLRWYFCLNFIKNIDFILYFHKNALLTPNFNDFHDLSTLVAKFLWQNLRIFSAIFFGPEKWTPPNFPLLEVIIGPWLYDKILDYCVLFKSEHHCKHTNRYHIHPLKTLVNN